MNNFILGPFWPIHHKHCVHRFFLKLEKPHFGPILGPFSPKVGQQELFQKILKLLNGKMQMKTYPKNQKISKSGSREKIQANRQMGKKNEQRTFHRTLNSLIQNRNKNLKVLFKTALFINNFPLKCYRLIWYSWLNLLKINKNIC